MLQKGASMFRLPNVHAVLHVAALALTFAPACSDSSHEREDELSAELTAAATGKLVTDAMGSRELSVELPALGSASDTCRTWRETRVPAD